MILDEMDDYDVYDDVVMNLYNELYDDIYIYIIPRMNVLLFFVGTAGRWSHSSSVGQGERCRWLERTDLCRYLVMRRRSLSHPLFASGGLPLTLNGFLSLPSVLRVAGSAKSFPTGHQAAAQASIWSRHCPANQLLQESADEAHTHTHSVNRATSTTSCVIVKPLSHHCLSCIFLILPAKGWGGRRPGQSAPFAPPLGVNYLII